MDRHITSPLRPRRAARGVANISWVRYLGSIAATFVSFLLLYIGVLASLDAAGALPPPAIVNELCADEKLKWLRDNPPKDVNLLVVGSSIAWRNVDSAEFVRKDPSSRPINAGVCHLKVNQTEFVTRYLLQHLPSIETVVTVLVPQDFDDCPESTSRIFNPETADSYVFDRGWKYAFYLRQFDPVSLIRNASEIRAMREGRNPTDTLVMSRYGDGPLDTDGSDRLIYGAAEKYDPSCFAALRTLAKTLRTEGIRFFVAMGPLSPAWSARFDPQGRLRHKLATNIATALRGTASGFWDGDSAFPSGASDFVDAIHITWLAAHRYTGLLAAALDTPRDQH